MTPWGILTPDQFRPLGPPALDSPQYLLEFLETKEMRRNTSVLRTSDETAACFFWNSSSPTFLWNRAALDLAAGEDAELSAYARLMATLNLAIADALIACWDAKYTYEFWRPVTAIRLAETDGDPNWTPLLTTPAHPEYTSGHSSLSSAAATVLSAYFGDDTPFFLESTAGVVRIYPNFSSAIDEVADARVFAGIHFRAACVEGAGVGSDVADYILENQMWHLHGRGDE